MRQEEFASFVDAQLPGLLGYARALAGNQHDAWDLTQEALARVGARWPRLERDGNPAAYARTTLVRLNIDRHRRARRERLIEVVPDRVADEVEPAGIEPWLRDAIRALPVRQRTALVLRYVDDLDHRGIADAMGCTVGTAKSHVSRGLAALRARAPQGSSFETIEGSPS